MGFAINYINILSLLNLKKYAKGTVAVIKTKKIIMPEREGHLQ